MDIKDKFEIYSALKDILCFGIESINESMVIVDMDYKKSGKHKR